MMKALALASLAGLLSLNVAFAGEHAANEDEIRRLIVGHIVSCGGANCRYGSDGWYRRCHASAGNEGER